MIFNTFPSFANLLLQQFLANPGIMSRQFVKNPSICLLLGFQRFNLQNFYIKMISILLKLKSGKKNLLTRSARLLAAFSLSVFCSSVLTRISSILVFSSSIVSLCWSTVSLKSLISSAWSSMMSCRFSMASSSFFQNGPGFGSTSPKFLVYFRFLIVVS